MNRRSRGCIAAAVAVLAAAPAPCSAAPRWTRVQAGSLIVMGDQPASRLRDIAVQVQQFGAVVGNLIQSTGRTPPRPTIVFVFGSRKAMASVVPKYNGRPLDLAGYFADGPEANYVVLCLEDFRSAAETVYHEYTHLLLRNAVRSIPVWLNEGLAEFYSTYSLEDGGRSASIGRLSPWRITALQEQYIPVADVVAADQTSPLYNEGSRRSSFYAEAWALTHYLMTTVPGGAQQINRYVAAIGEGRAPLEAFAEAFGATPAEFDSRLRAYVHQSGFRAMRLTFPDRIAVREPSPPQAVAPPEVDAWLGSAQRRVQRTDEARARIERALAAGPDLAMTHFALGMLRAGQKQIPEALSDLRRASELAPDDFMIQFAYGTQLLINEPPEGSEANAAAAAAALRRAADVSPDSADAHAWLAYALMQSRPTLGDARIEIERAMTLAPGRLEYRLRYADIRILQGGVAEARGVLEAIARLSLERSASAAAAARLRAIADAVRKKPGERS